MDRGQRELMGKLVRFANLYVQLQNRPQTFAEGVQLTAAEIQMLEYLLENSQQHEKMNEIALQLGMTPSAFSISVKEMTRMGLLEKYHTSSNKKNVIIRVSKKGEEIYKTYCQWIHERQFQAFFAVLEEIPPRHIQTMCRAMDILNTPAVEIAPQDKPTLIRIK